MRIALMTAYGIALALLIPLTLAGRRDLSYWLGDDDAVELGEEGAVD